LTFFDVLGVAESAFDDEVASAHRRLAREFHPDAHPGASAAERASYAAAMAKINVADDAIKTSQRRAMYGPAEEAGHSASGQRAPREGECDLCGSAPARHFAFEYQTAWLLSGRRYLSSVELCRQCALDMGRAHQNRTLYTGWWGVAALFTNFGAVARNARQFRRAVQYPDPHSKGLFHGEVSGSRPSCSPVAAPQ
jgi:curved DNA-binding protein CbpA